MNKSLMVWQSCHWPAPLAGSRTDNQMDKVIAGHDFQALELTN
jgi:hypothetical protein